MRFLKLIYVEMDDEVRGRVPEQEEFGEILGRVQLEDVDFDVGTFPPGTSGEAGLFRYLKASLEE